MPKPKMDVKAVFKPRPRIVLDLKGPLPGQICEVISQKRLACNQGLNWHDKTVSQAENIRRGLVGALGELVIRLLFGIAWQGAILSTQTYLVWRKKCFDFGWIEVKTVPTLTGSLRVGSNDLKKGPGIIIWVYIENVNTNGDPMRAYVVAWATVAECLKFRQKVGKKPFYQIPRGKTRNADKLIKLRNVLDNLRAQGKTVLKTIMVRHKVVPTFVLETKQPAKWKIAIK